MLNLQFITHATTASGHVEAARMALEGGARWIQLRMKEASEAEVRDAALAVQALCRHYGATFVIDDRVELARLVGADGVHLGLHDMPIAEARRFLGPRFIIGGTANTICHVRLHAAAGADYIGLGPYRFTTTKQNLSPILGAEGCRHIVTAVRAEGIRLPLIAIGGITAEDIPIIYNTGVDGIAVSGTVLRAPDPVAEMRRLLAYPLPEHKPLTPDTP